MMIHFLGASLISLSFKISDGEDYIICHEMNLQRAIDLLLYLDTKRETEVSSSLNRTRIYMKYPKRIGNQFV